jgi:hypothetical protein
MRLTGFTLAALAYASVTSPAAGPGLEASPELRGYGLAASFDWLEVGRKDRVPYHMSAPAVALSRSPSPSSPPRGASRGPSSEPGDLQEPIGRPGPRPGRPAKS